MKDDGGLIQGTRMLAVGINIFGQSRGLADKQIAGVEKREESRRMLGFLFCAIALVVSFAVMHLVGEGTVWK